MSSAGGDSACVGLPDLRLNLGAVQFAQRLNLARLQPFPVLKFVERLHRLDLVKALSAVHDVRKRRVVVRFGQLNAGSVVEEITDLAACGNVRQCLGGSRTCLCLRETRCLFCPLGRLNRFGLPGVAKLQFIVEGVGYLAANELIIEKWG